MKIKKFGIIKTSLFNEVAPLASTSNLTFDLDRKHIVPVFASLTTTAAHHHRPTQVPLFLLAAATERLRVIKVQGDGKCMFRALAIGLNRNLGKFLGAEAETREADALRLACAEALCRTEARRDDFEEAMVAVKAEGPLDAYCKRIMSPKFWGGEAELLVLSKMLQVPIYVYVDSGNGFKAIQKYGIDFAAKKGKKGRKVLRLLYSNGNHYDLLV
jgi:hypothetical protein